jgi:hypothetical protein
MRILFFEYEYIFVLLSSEVLEFLNSFILILKLPFLE